VGVLHAEMRHLDSLIMAAADAHRVPAGSALAVDRDGFSAQVQGALEAEPLVTLRREEVAGVPPADWANVIVATGPLTSPALAEAVQSLTGEDALAFFDAIAPIVHRDSIDFSKAWFQSRYDKGDGTDYINCPLSRDDYEAFIDALLAADAVPFKDWKADTPYFEGCLPIEVMAARGRRTLAFGPMKPVGLSNPHDDGRRPYAVVQLRQDNTLGSLYNIVGFQTKMRHAEQVRVFRMIPGLENAEFARLGGIHRNTFINGPRLLDPTLRLKAEPRLRFAGQITGCEGYVESAAIGLLAGRFAAAESRAERPDLPPPPTALEALLGHVTGGGMAETYQPMNVNFGLFPPSTRLTGAAGRSRAASARRPWPARRSPISRPGWRSKNRRRPAARSRWASVRRSKPSVCRRRRPAPYARPAACDGEARVRIARCRRMPGGNEGVDEGFVLGGELVVEGAQVVGPLVFRSRPGDDGANQRVVEHPVHGELAGRHATLVGALLERLGEDQGLGAELGLQHPFVAAPRPRAVRRLGVGEVFPRENTPCQRAVRNDADAVVPAGGQDLHLGHPVYGVVVGLADHWPGHAQGLGDADQFGDAPARIVVEAPVADLSRRQQVVHGTQSLLQRRRRIVEVEVVDIDVVGVEAAEAVIDGAVQPFAPQPPHVGILAHLDHRVGDLGRQHPAVAVLADQLSDDALGGTEGIGVGGVDEVDAGVAPCLDDPLGCVLEDLVAEHHGAEADRRNPQSAAPESPVFHAEVLRHALIGGAC